MFAQAVIISVFLVNYSLADCILQVDQLNCSNVDLPEIIENYENNKVKSVNFQSCGVQSLNYFPFSSVNTVKLECGIEEIKNTAFIGLGGVRQIDLCGNKLERLNEDIFEPLEHLEVLHICRNALKNPKNWLFKHLSNLETLNLSSNRMSNINTASFDGLGNVKTINISRNRINEIIAGVFDNNPLLEDVDVSYNQLHDLFDNMFEDNLRLKSIRLNNNPIVELPDTLFSKNKELVELDVSATKIIGLNSSVFSGLVKLRSLNIGRNSIRELPVGVFDSLVLAETIFMNKMLLKELPNGVFVKTVQLQYLDISENEIHVMPDDVFSKTKLVSLHMSSNKVTKLPVGSLTTLKQLDASNNNIESIDNVFEAPNLLHLNVAGNKIKHISYNYNKTIHLISLNIINNYLVDINGAFFSSASNIKTFDFVANPWECKCFNKILSIVSQRKLVYNKLDYFTGERSFCIALSNCPVEPDRLQQYYDKITEFHT